jgi:hypothetical protein
VGGGVVVGSGLAVLPAVGDQAAVGLVLPHQTFEVFSCQT